MKDVQLSDEFISMCAKGEFNEGSPYPVIVAMAEEIRYLRATVSRYAREEYDRYAGLQQQAPSVPSGLMECMEAPWRTDRGGD